MTIKLKLSEASPDLPVSQQLERQAPFIHSKLAPKCTQAKLIKGELTETDTDALIRDTLETVELHGRWGYRLQGKTQEGDPLKDKGYLGMGLTYNPNHIDLTMDPLVDPHEQVQGNHNPGHQGTKEFGSNSGNPYSRVTDPEARRRAVKLNSHYDTYSMAYRTEGSRHGYLGTFLDSLKRSMVRSSIRIINAAARGQQMGPDGAVNSVHRAGVSWHVDESMFENLRINIAVKTDPMFVLEQHHRKGELFHLEAPYAYSWDTGVPHRAYATQQTAEPFYRTHIMLGLAPWWDFDEATGTWTQNEFHGKKHPWDMLVDGDIIPGFKLIAEI